MNDTCLMSFLQLHLSQCILQYSPLSSSLYLSGFLHRLYNSSTNLNENNLRFSLKKKESDAL